VAAVNRMKAETPALNQEGPQTRFTDPEDPLVGLLRREEEGAGRAAALINPDPDQGHDFAVAELASALETEPAELRVLPPMRQGPAPAGREPVRVETRSMRIFGPDQ
jgi:starch synthase (maltosyl-transferring)